IQLDSPRKPNAETAVVWDMMGASPAYDPSIRDTQTFVLTGTVVLPEGVDPNGVALEAEVSVTVARIGVADKTDLNTEIQKALQGAKDTGVSSKEGADITPGQYWVAPEVKEALQAAIDRAVEVSKNDFATEQEVADEVVALQSALEAFGKAKKEAISREALKAALESAMRAKSAVVASDDGQDVAPEQLWVTNDSLQELEKAISDARAIEDNPGVTQKEIDGATEALDNAIRFFVAKQANGLKQPDEPPATNPPALDPPTTDTTDPSREALPASSSGVLSSEGSTASQKTPRSSDPSGSETSSESIATVTVKPENAPSTSSGKVGGSAARFESAFLSTWGPLLVILIFTGGVIALSLALYASSREKRRRR
ncbi:MAG TPA: hypothetical protein DEB24_06295, partial [Coriobacteriia bacterium]|nr:hypothetical protein [Coriobacteriia bacterium]